MILLVRSSRSPWALLRQDVWPIRGASSIDLHVSNQSQIADQALQYIAQLYAVEREVKNLHADERRQIRQAQAQAQAKPLVDAMHKWMQLQRQKVTDGSAIAKALD